VHSENSCEHSAPASAQTAVELAHAAHAVTTSPRKRGTHGDHRPRQTASHAEPAGKTRQPLFESLLTLRSPAGRTWPVIYEATLSCNQYHRRLSHGWRDFCRECNVQMGDVVEFQRCPLPDVNALTVRVIKRRRM
jgi:hypothetical protein